MADTKSTRVLFREVIGHEWLVFDPEPPLDVGVVYSATGDHRIIYSENHPGYRNLRANGRDIGGPFHLRKHIYDEFSDAPDFLRSPGGTYRYRGPQYAQHSSVGPEHFPDISASDLVDLEAFGATAIARTIPTNPVAGLATYLGEMRDGIPSITGSDFFRSRALTAKNAGSEYLNVEFGWKPLVSDLQSFASAVTNSDKTLRQYERNSGKGVRRTYKLTFPDEVDVVEGTDFPEPTLTGPIYVNAEGPMTITSTYKRELSFSGCFTYYLEPLRSDGRGGRGWLQRANKLFGARLTPETLWDIEPWSWGADWFANIGDNFHNVSAFQHDGLVMRYGYVTEKISKRVTYNLTGITYGNVSEPRSFMQSFTTKVIRRIQATPLGFGLNPILDFTDRQWAITTALGLTRGGR